MSELTLRRLDELRLPGHLDGSQGSNRAPAGNQLGADDDLGAVRLFLAEYLGSPSTHRAYQKEAERLVLWAVLERGRPLSSLTREDLAAYAEFLRDPQPRARWCGPRRARGGPRFTPGWRPFVGPLGPSARRTALTIINSLLNYLVQGGYLLGNPLSLLRQRGRPETAGPAVRQRVRRRSLDPVQWTAVLDTVEGLQRDTVAARAAAERARFLLALLHFLALRIGEVATHRMGDFQQVRGRWVLCVTGKGRKAAELPVNDEMLEALRRYRLALGLPALPQPDDEAPLIGDLLAAGASARRCSLTARRMNQVLKDLLQQAAERLLPGDPHRAEGLRRASAHWFRHTSLTRQSEAGIPLAHLKENARHSKLDTTLLYVHADEDARHEEARKHTWR